MKRMILLIGITAAALGLSAAAQPAQAHELYKHAPYASKHVTKQAVKSDHRQLRQWRHQQRRFRRWNYRHPRYHRPRFYRPRPHRYVPRGYWYGGYYSPPVRATFSLRYNGYPHRY